MTIVRQIDPRFSLYPYACNREKIPPPLGGCKSEFGMAVGVSFC